MMMMQTQFFGRLTVFAASAMLLLSGCGTASGYKQADKTGAGLSEFRAQILRGQHDIDETMKSLSDVSASANINPRPAYERYSMNVAKLQASATRVEKLAVTIHEQGQAYFEQWDTQLSEVNNPDIRKVAEERKNKLKAAFDSLRQLAEPLKAQFDPWMSDLKDLQTYLGNDLTLSGVDAASTLISKTKDEGRQLQKSIEGLVAQLNTVAANITPANVEPQSEPKQ